MKKREHNVRMWNLICFFMLACFWGGSFIAIKNVIEILPSMSGAALRVSTALIFLLLYYKLKKLNTEMKLRAKLQCYLLGLFGLVIPFLFLFWGERYVNAGIAGVINGTTPIWTFIIASSFFKSERSFILVKSIGVILAFGGLVVMCLENIQMSGTGMEIYGILAILVMAFSYGVASNLGRQFFTKHSVDPKIAVYHQHVFSAFILVAIAFVFEGRAFIESAQNVNFSVVGSVLYLGIFSTGIAFMIYFRLLKEWGPLKATSVTYLIPIMALIFDYIFFGNKPSELQAMGMLVILFGLLIIQQPKLLYRLFGKLPQSKFKKA
ncbi:MAG: DMT family transporter [Bdellovibrionales bacterium]